MNNQTVTLNSDQVAILANLLTTLTQNLEYHRDRFEAMDDFDDPNSSVADMLDAGIPALKDLVGQLKF